MKIKTSELKGTALDWAVARCKGVEVQYLNDGITRCLLRLAPFTGVYKPSTNWSQAGEIIEREKISVVITNAMGWKAAVPFSFDKDVEMYEYGPTPLIAAMRCYVASVLGDEIEIPQELL